jgi:hypothetical protein
MPDKNFQNLTDAEIEKIVYEWANRQLGQMSREEKAALCPCPKCQAKRLDQEAWQKSTQAAFSEAGWSAFTQKPERPDMISEYEQFVVTCRMRAMELAIEFHTGHAPSVPVDLVNTAKVIFEFLNNGGETPEQEP